MAAPTPQVPPRRHRPWVVVVGAVAVVALAAGVAIGAVELFGRGGAGLLARVNPTSGPTDGPTQAPDLGESEFAEVLTGISPAEEFVIPIGFDPETITVDGEHALPFDFAEVFIDPMLTIEAPDSSVEAFDGEITVAPLSSPVRAQSPGMSIDLSPGGVWGFTDQYYLAEYRDRATGELLDEPRVTAFSLAAEVPTVDVSFEVDADGIGHISWEEVPAATRYFVIAVDILHSDAEIIGDTDLTTWSTAEDDEHLQDALAGEDRYGLGVTGQNGAFEAFVLSEDMLHDDGTVVDESDNLRPRAYGVVAMTPDGPSPMSFLDDPSVASSLPVFPAEGAAREMRRIAEEETGGVGRLPVQYPVTMADGRTVLMPIAYDPARIAPTEYIIDGAAVMGFDVPYRIEGTLFEGDVRVPEAVSVEDAQARVQAVAEQVAAARARTGAAPAYAYRTGKVEVTDVSTTAPDVGYPVHGTNPLTTYLAANIIAGEAFISVADYLEGSSSMTSTGIDLWDAVDEALAQNPYAIGRVELTYLEKDRVLAVFYPTYPDMGERAANQAALAAEAERVVAEVVDDTMTPEEKVIALNDYLVASAEYDDVALAAVDTVFSFDPNNPTADELRNSWDAVGVLLDKTGVCASYAKAFLLLADAAGLDAMYVTGEVTNGARHAWNKVLVGDTWRAVDVTWNDSPSGNAFLLVTDATMAETRTEGSDWVVDTRVRDYAAR